MSTNYFGCRHGLVGPVDLWQEKRKFQFDFLRKMGLQAGHVFLDLGCGTLRGGIPIIAYLETGHYTGVDVRSEIKNEALMELEESGLTEKNPSLIFTGDLTKLQLDYTFDIIWAFSVLIHLSDDQLAVLIDFVGRHLKTRGKFFSNVLIGNSPDGHWREFPLVERSENFYLEMFKKKNLTMNNLGCLSDFGHISNVRDKSILEKQRMLMFNRSEEEQK